MTTLVRADEVREGMILDLEADPIADPNHDVMTLSCECVVVFGVERETPDCVCIWTDWDGCGFPPDHQLKLEGWMPGYGGS